jgi:hypothetical protein
VQARKIAAQYLAPYVYGEDRFLGGKKAMLVPRDVGLNQFGNLPRNKLKTLKGKPNIFVGTIKFKKSGKTISGIWQRPDNGLRRSGYRGTKGATRGAKTASSVAGTATGLKLLIQFEDTTPAPKHLPFYERARAYVAKQGTNSPLPCVRHSRPPVVVGTGRCPPPRLRPSHRGRLRVLPTPIGNVGNCAPRCAASYGSEKVSAPKCPHQLSSSRSANSHGVTVAMTSLFVEP